MLSASTDGEMARVQDLAREPSFLGRFRVLLSICQPGRPGQDQQEKARESRDETPSSFPPQSYLLSLHALYNQAKYQDIGKGELFASEKIKKTKILPPHTLGQS